MGIGIGLGIGIGSSGGAALPVVDFSQQFQVDASLSALGVVDFSQGIDVTVSLSPSTGPIARFGAALHQWFRADDVVLSGSNVTTCADRSGKDYHGIPGATAPTHTAVNATLDGRPTIAFNGNSFLNSAGLTCNLATEDFYIWFMFKPTLPFTSGSTFSGGQSSNSPRLTQISPSPNMRGSSTSAANVNSGAAMGVWSRGEALWTLTAGASYLKLGSTLITSATGGNPGAGTRTSSSLGALVTAGVGSNFFNGEFAEYVVVKRPAGSGGPTGPERAGQDADGFARYPSAVF
jgi:hypothetical protein